MIQPTAAAVALYVDMLDPKRIAFAGNDGADKWQFAITLYLSVSITAAQRRSVIRSHGAHVTISLIAHSLGEINDKTRRLQRGLQDHIDNLSLNDALDSFVEIANAHKVKAEAKL